jgi:hypothetical protein
MTTSMYRIALALVACLALATTASAKKVNTSKTPSPRRTETVDGKEKVMLEIAGPTDSQAAEAFQKAFTAHGLKAKVEANKRGGKPLKLVAQVDNATDLGPWSKAVSAVAPKKRGQAAAALDLVIFAPITKDNQAQVLSSLEKVKGVDAKHSSADLKKGLLHVRISGADHVTADDISKAVKDAGVTGQFARTSKNKTTKAKKI